MANHRRLVTDAAKRADRVNRIRMNTGHIFVVHGSIEMPGPGEATALVRFPVKFVERPVVSFGGGLLLGSPEAQNFPEVNGVVIEWLTDDSSPNGVTGGGILYTGARIAITAYGAEEQRFYLDYRFEATALTPSSTDVELDEEL